MASLNPSLKIKNFRLTNENRVIIGNLININSLANKFDQLKEILLKFIGTFVITETKLDDTFPMRNFWSMDFPKYFALIGIGKGVEL